MKYLYLKYAYLFVLGSLLAACSSQAFKVTAVSQSSEMSVHFNQLSAFAVEEGVKVHGHITGNGETKLPAGHIEVIAYDLEGKVLDKTTVFHPSRVTDRRTRKSRLHFSALLKKLPPDTVIHVMFHSNSDTPETPAERSIP